MAQPYIDFEVTKKGVILILILLGFGAAYYVSQNFEALAQKYQQVSTTTETTILLKESVADSLNVLWNSHSAAPNNKEFITCLTGKQKGNVIIIDGIQGTEVFTFNQTEITHKSCSSSFSLSIVGDIHSHPSGTCRFSMQDKETFLNSKYSLKALACGIDRFAFFSRDDMNTPLSLVVA